MSVNMISGWEQAAYMGIQATRQMELISHNLANTSTIGFKREMIDTWRLDAAPTKKTVDLPKDRPSFPGGEIAKDLALRDAHYVDVQHRDYSQGPIRHTGSETDLAIEGKGFFKVETPKGSRYTRDGGFRINQDNQLITREGYLVQGKGGPIVLNAIDKNFIIDQEGGIHLDQTLGDQIDVVDFNNPQGLRREGDNLYAATEISGAEQPAQNARIRQGEIEESNINPMSEVVKMMNTFRQFEALTKTMQSFKDSDDRVIKEVGRLA